MRPGLLTEDRVDGPPAIEPDLDPRVVQATEYVDHISSEQPSSLLFAGAFKLSTIAGGSSIGAVAGALLPGAQGAALVALPLT